MLVDAVLEFFASIYLGLLDLLPDPGFPYFVSGEGEGTLTGSMEWFVDNLGPMAGWVNMPVLYGAVGFLVLTAGVAHAWNVSMAFVRTIRG